MFPLDQYIPFGPGDCVEQVHGRRIDLHRPRAGSAQAFRSTDTEKKRRISTRMAGQSEHVLAVFEFVLQTGLNLGGLVYWLTASGGKRNQPYRHFQEYDTACAQLV